MRNKNRNPSAQVSTSPSRHLLTHLVQSQTQVTAALSDYTSRPAPPAYKCYPQNCVLKPQEADALVRLPRWMKTCAECPTSTPGALLLHNTPPSRRLFFCPRPSFLLLFLSPSLPFAFLLSALEANFSALHTLLFHLQALPFWHRDLLYNPGEPWTHDLRFQPPEC